MIKCERCISYRSEDRIQFIGCISYRSEDSRAIGSLQGTADAGNTQRVGVTRLARQHLWKVETRNCRCRFIQKGTMCWSNTAGRAAPQENIDRGIFGSGPFFRLWKEWTTFLFGISLKKGLSHPETSPSQSSRFYLDPVDGLLTPQICNRVIISILKAALSF